MSKTILITGASSGIGKATAKYFQEKGWNVVATMRTPEKEEELNQIDNIHVTKLDVQDLGSIDNAINEGIEKFGKIDVVLNNAGYGLMGPFEAASREKIQRQYDVNVFGLFDVTRAALPHFRANKDGMFINISSIGGRVTFPLISMYHSTKFAVEGFSESLRYELEPLGIKVKIVEPGGVATDFGGRSLDMQHDESLEDYNPMVNGMMKNMQENWDPANMSTAEFIAESIYNAATDDSDRLRYLAGPDAEQLMGARTQMNDSEFASMIKQQYGA